jgi:hypothetical protein
MKGRNTEVTFGVLFQNSPGIPRRLRATYDRWLLVVPPTPSPASVNHRRSWFGVESQAKGILLVAFWLSFLPEPMLLKGLTNVSNPKSHGVSMLPEPPGHCYLVSVLFKEQLPDKPKVRVKLVPNFGEGYFEIGISFER